MESNKLDQLFKNKLERHHSEPSKEAWSMLAEQLNASKKGSKKFYFLSIAASVCLLVISLVVLFSTSHLFNSNETDQMAVQINDNANSISIQQGIIELPIAATQAENNSINSKVAVQKKERDIRNTKSFSQLESMPKDIDPILKMEKVERIAINTVDRNSIKEANYHLELKDVSTELIVVHTFHEERTQEVKESSNPIIKTKDKIKSLASELSIADLRSAKNELFASALQVEKRRNN